MGPVAPFVVAADCATPGAAADATGPVVPAADATLKNRGALTKAKGGNGKYGQSHSQAGNGRNGCAGALLHVGSSWVSRASSTLWVLLRVSEPSCRGSCGLPLHSPSAEEGQACTGTNRTNNVATELFRHYLHVSNRE